MACLLVWFAEVEVVHSAAVLGRLPWALPPTLANCSGAWGSTVVPPPRQPTRPLSSVGVRVADHGVVHADAHGAGPPAEGDPLAWGVRGDPQFPPLLRGLALAALRLAGAGGTLGEEAAPACSLPPVNKDSHILCRVLTWGIGGGGGVDVAGARRGLGVGQAQVSSVGAPALATLTAP
jgi:hypothetical protein